ncbi:MAG: hypothetical protein IT424_07125 [Pirellulales bacterium]|nr:hypothetical protein [Pirellulales bacterium]
MRLRSSALEIAPVMAILLAQAGVARGQGPSSVPGDFTVGGAIHLDGFSIRPGVVFEVPDELRFQRGGVSDPLPPSHGRIRAQPGGNFEIAPLGDYYRGALDIYPTQGKKPDTDALAELTIHRLFPSNEGHEMLSVSALADSQSRFGLIVEAHGSGRVKPLDFQMIQGGLLAVDRGLEPFDAVAMRMKTDGTMQFSAVRHGGEPGPVDAISVERDQPGAAREQASDYIRLTAKRTDGELTRADWRMNAQLSAASSSSFALESRDGNEPYEAKLKATSAGDLELPTAGASIMLTSPNGKRWRLSVSDDGDLRTEEIVE